MRLDGRDVILLDGGTGQELQRRSRTPASPLWSAQVMRDEPELVEAVHRDFLDAGAGVITVTAYSATPERLARDGAPERFEELQKAALAAARRARDARGRDARIAGCLPPLVASYRRIVAAQRADVDLFLCETQAAIGEARAATVEAAASGLPVWCAFTVDDGDGTRLRSGEALSDAARAVLDAGARAVLVNCSVPEAIATGVAELARLDVPCGAYANGFEPEGRLDPGGTVETLTARTDLDPAAYADHALGWAAAGARIVGGCCEVGPAHIAEIARRLEADGARLAAELPA